MKSETENMKWLFVAKRSETPPLPITNKFISLSGPLAAKLYFTTVSSLVVRRNGEMEWYVDSAQYNKSIEVITSLLLGKKSLKHIEKALLLCKKLRDNVSFFNKEDLTKIKSNELLRRYKKVVDIYANAFVYGYVTWCSKNLQSRAIDILKNKEAVLLNIELDNSKALGVLIKQKKTIYSYKEIALNRLAEKYNFISKEKAIDEDLIKRNYPDLDKAISKFIKKYGWVGYDYSGPTLSYMEVVEVIKNRKQKEPEQSISKKDILKACGFSFEEKKVFKIFESLSYIKDVRNSSDDFTHYCLDIFFQEIGKRYGLEKVDVRYLWPEELENLISGKVSYSKEYIEKKKKMCVLLACNGKQTYWFGDDAEKEAQKRLDLVEVKEKFTELVGMCASSGKVSGIVKILNNYNEMDKLKEGDILVTNMTSPRYMAAILRSGAIVTDEGGLTCHAAIIAREIKKPCVVGTKIASKVFKDGDKIEVDANKGIIKIIIK